MRIKGATGKSKEEKAMKFELFEDGEEDHLPRQLDKGLLMLRQIDRINQTAAAGDTTAYINSVNQLFYFLSPDFDKKILKEISEETDAYREAGTKTKDRYKQNNLDITFAQNKFRLLMGLLKRKGLR